MWLLLINSVMTFFSNQSFVGESEKSTEMSYNFFENVMFQKIQVSRT